MNDKMPSLLAGAVGLGTASDFYSDTIKASHQVKCDSSCPDCLRHFRNMQYHGLLDWRLAISLLRIFHDKSHCCGLDGNFEAYPEIQDWMLTAKREANRVCQAFGPDGSWSPQKFGTLSGFLINGGKPGIIIHPLWHRRSSSGILADAIAEAEDYGASVILADTFNLTRRLSWSRMQWEK